MRALILIPLLLASCAGPGPARVPVRNGPLTLDDARNLVAELEAEQASRNPNDPLRTPVSLAEGLEILRRDELDLFPAGSTLAARERGPEAEALHAQIELAWGEAQLLLAEILWELSGRLAGSARRLSVQVATGERDELDVDELAELRREARRLAGLSQALPLLAAEHLATGARLARELMAAHPDNYLGYRVVADYYRLREDWPAFADMIRKIEERNPESVGLLFLRGVAAAARDGDQAAAATFLRAALAKDPKFVRAQAQLLLAQPTLAGTFAEFANLRELNPHHQIVVWAGDIIAQLHALEARRPPPPPAAVP